MPDKFNRPTEPSHALYHDVLCGNIAAVQKAIRETPELIRGKPVVGGAWSHGGRRCGAQDDVIACLQLLADNGADFSKLGAGTYDSAFKAFPRAAALLFELGADPNSPADEGKTGLHCMASIGNRYACEILLRHGADLNAKDNAGETPLDVAMKDNLPRMVQFLRKRGAESSATDRDKEACLPMTRDVEVSDGRFSGEVTWYRADRGYGYLRDSLRGGPGDGVPDGPNVYGELFFDRDSIIVGSEPSAIEEGTSLSFEVTHDEFGLRATNVEFIQIDEESNP